MRCKQKFLIFYTMFSRCLQILYTQNSSIVATKWLFNLGLTILYEYKVETFLKYAAWTWVKLSQVFGTSYSQFDFRARSNVEGWIQNWTRHVFVKHGCHRRQQSPNLESSTFWHAPTPWHVMSVNNEQPFDKLTVQVWLFYDHQNFKHVQVGRNYGQTDWKTDGRTIQLIDVPGIPFR